MSDDADEMLRHVPEVEGTSVSARLNRYARLDEVNAPYVRCQRETEDPVLGQRALEVGLGVGRSVHNEPWRGGVMGVGAGGEWVGGCRRSALLGGVVCEHIDIWCDAG